MNIHEGKSKFCISVLHPKSVKNSVDPVQMAFLKAS